MARDSRFSGFSLNYSINFIKYDKQKKSMPTTFYIQNQACPANFADSEQMAGLLKEADFELVENIEDAYVIIHNICTVESPDKNVFFKNLDILKEENPNQIHIIAGCIPQGDQQKLKQYSLVGAKQIHNIVQVVEEALHDNVLQLLNNDEMPPLDLPKIRRSSMVEILPISRGCLDTCTFCKTKKTRANLVSYPVDEIIAAAKKALKEEVKEIWLTSHDAFGYGFDINTDLSVLLERLVEIPGDFRIKVGVGSPDLISKMEDKLIEIFKHPKIFKFLHLPLQTGSDTVLRQMKKRYTVREFNRILNKFKEAIPSLNVMTDIIVGHPAEQEQDFWETLEAVRKNSFDSINIFEFCPQPDTPAAVFRELPVEEVRRRSGVLTDIFNNISRLQNEKWFGWEGIIIIDEKVNDGQWSGRNNHYKLVVVEGNFRIGDEVKVKIVKTGAFGLKGEWIKDKVEIF